MKNARETILDAVSNGIMSADDVLNIVINYWMSEQEVGEMIEGQIDFEDLREPEEFEPEIDGIQLRYIIHNDSPESFNATVHMILENGQDSIDPRYTVTPELYVALTDEVDFYDAEETIDYFRNSERLPYADHYLDEHDDVVWAEV